MEGEVQLVACAINGEEYAVDIRSVQEIIRHLEITRVPHALPFMSGVINLRGMVIPVMDIRKRFRLPGKAPDESTRIIIVNSHGLLMGILVDSVSEVIRLPENDIELPLTSSSNINAEFITGIGKLGYRLLIILNLDNIIRINSDV